VLDHHVAKTMTDNDWKTLKNCVAYACDNYGKGTWTRFMGWFETQHRLQINAYQGSRWLISPDNDNLTRIEVEVLCFDEYDGQNESIKLFSNIKDLLAVFTNSALVNIGEPSKIDGSISYVGGPYYDDNDWIDNKPLIKGRLALDKDCIYALDLLLENDHDYIEILIPAWSHFYDAVKSMELLGGDEDISIVLAVSALEVAASASANPSDRCPTCNQEIFNIRKRVIGFAERYSGAALACWIDGYYNSRSKFLHSGTRGMHSDRAPLRYALRYGLIVPTLAGGEGHGFFGSNSRSARNVIEISSHALRAHIRQRLAHSAENENRGRAVSIVGSSDLFSMCEAASCPDVRGSSSPTPPCTSSSVATPSIPKMITAFILNSWAMFIRHLR
jgi:hypothetical protein